MSALSEPAQAARAKMTSGRFRKWPFPLVISLAVMFWLGLALFAHDIGHGAAIVSAPDTFEPSSPDSFGSTLPLEYDHDAVVVITASIANRGTFPVTIYGVQLFPPLTIDSADQPHLLLEQVQVTIEGSGSELPADRTLTDPIDLETGSVTLGPGQELDVAIAARFGDCDFYEPGTGNEFEVIRVDYQHLGIPRTTEIPIRPVVVVAPEDRPTA